MRWQFQIYNMFKFLDVYCKKILHAFTILSSPDNPDVKKRVLIALGLLVGAKLLNITVPFLFKHAIDLLNSASGGKLNLVI